MNLSADTIRHTLDDVFHPGNFLVADTLQLEWLRLPEEIVPWEIFRGRLLEPAHCFEERRFQSWCVFERTGAERSAEPLLSIRLSQAERCVHVTRAVLAHVWEGYDAGDNVILSREATRWVRELVGTILLDEITDADDLRGEAATLLFQAVVGTSRLPLTSLEAPLPAFTLGQLGYLLLPYGLSRWLELQLRRGKPNTADLVERWRELGQQADALPAVLRQMFNEVSLSPYTDFVDNTFHFLRDLVRHGQLSVVDQVDLLGYLLRQLGRHLTAYDLITFHYRGANYPDALLLDAALRETVALLESNAGLFEGPERAARIRRRALRQGCLLRQAYQDHLVPDIPTSPGENARVMPAPFTRVAEEQILQATKRQRKLYDQEPLASLLPVSAVNVLCEALRDVANPLESREVGLAVFVDRPLGAGKLPGEPDQTPLLAYEAFSRSIAERRLGELRTLAQALGRDVDIRLHDAPVAGFPARAAWSPDRPAVSLADATRVADDFVLLRTLPGSVKQLVELLESVGQAFQPAMADRNVLIVPISAGVLGVFDVGQAAMAGWKACPTGTLPKHLQLRFDPQAGYRSRRGVEFPRRVTLAMGP